MALFILIANDGRRLRFTLRVLSHAVSCLLSFDLTWLHQCKYIYCMYAGKSPFRVMEPITWWKQCHCLHRLKCFITFWLKTPEKKDLNTDKVQGELQTLWEHDCSNKSNQMLAAHFYWVKHRRILTCEFVPLANNKTPWQCWPFEKTESPKLTNESNSPSCVLATDFS